MDREGSTLAALPYIQLYIADYLADTAHLTAAQHGAYLLLIFNYWQRGHALNNTNGRLASVARMLNDEWKQNESTLAEFFEVEGTTWFSARIERDLAAVADKSTKASQAGRASGVIRRAKNEQALNERRTNVQQTLNHTDTDTDTDTEKSLKAKGDKSPLVLPDWLPAELWADWHNYRNTRKGWTAKARKLSMSTLSRLHDEGQDARTVINLAIERGWTGLFAPRAGSPSAPIKPPIAQNFSQKNYSTTGTPDNELPDFLRTNKA